MPFVPNPLGPWLPQIWMPEPFQPLPTPAQVSAAVNQTIDAGQQATTTLLTSLPNPSNVVAVTNTGTGQTTGIQGVVSTQQFNDFAVKVSNQFERLEQSIAALSVSNLQNQGMGYGYGGFQMGQGGCGSSGVAAGLATPVFVVNGAFNAPPAPSGGFGGMDPLMLVLLLGGGLGGAGTSTIDPLLLILLMGGMGGGGGNNNLLLLLLLSGGTLFG